MLERRKSVEIVPKWHRKVLLGQENLMKSSIITEIIEDLSKLEHKLLNLMPRQPQAKYSLGNEAEELHRKQLAIEKEIKLLKEQQQKSFYVRNIPNKPPPPYRPSPSKTTQKSPSVIPASKEEIAQITEYSAKILHKAYLSRNLDYVCISDNILNLIGKNINKGCYKYVFDLCKEIAKDHYGQFAEAGPSWMDSNQKNPKKPLDVTGLNKLMTKKLLQLFGFEKAKPSTNDKLPKRKHLLEEILKQEMRAEEGTWTNFAEDEALIKNKVVDELMEMLLKESVVVIKKVIEKKQEQ